MVWQEMMNGNKDGEKVRKRSKKKGKSGWEKIGVKLKTRERRIQHYEEQATKQGRKRNEREAIEKRRMNIEMRLMGG